ncbi:hypothetical protein BJ508DRAFT_339676 [Ascobolus immersus RN42]|uniref:FAS1 domain-containing protein n=1 Tax=Ascobolus immersus RN42 TaxID=1160509 RepID=A0A3N4HNB9_ASCIM|nr:hypothetical protein BJ508DRAFT_339676 [Ascobolus immersus RN42]
MKLHTFVSLTFLPFAFTASLPPRTPIQKVLTLSNLTVPADFLAQFFPTPGSTIDFSNPDTLNALREYGEKHITFSLSTLADLPDYDGPSTARTTIKPDEAIAMLSNPPNSALSSSDDEGEDAGRTQCETSAGSPYYTTIYTLGSYLYAYLKSLERHQLSLSSSNSLYTLGEPNCGNANRVGSKCSTVLHTTNHVDGHGAAGTCGRVRHLGCGMFLWRMVRVMQACKADVEGVKVGGSQWFDDERQRVIIFRG